MVHTFYLYVIEATSGVRWWYDYNVWKDLLIPLIGPLVIAAAAFWAAKAQIGPLRDQLNHMKKQASDDRQHREISMAWSLAIEAQRLSGAAKIILDAVKKKDNNLPAIQKKRLSISVYGFARGDRPDIVFLKPELQTLLARLLNTIDKYNVTIEVLHTKSHEENVNVPENSEAFKLLTDIQDQGRKLSDAIKAKYPSAD